MTPVISRVIPLNDGGISEVDMTTLAHRLY